MKAYIVQIVGAAMLAVFGDLLSPQGWKKYTSIITGLILLCVIASPVADRLDFDITSGYRESLEAAISGKEMYSSMLSAEFSKNIAEDVKSRVYEEFGKDISVQVMTEADDNGNIKSISRIVIKGENLGLDIARRISEIYNVDEVILDGVG